MSVQDARREVAHMRATFSDALPEAATVCEAARAVPGDPAGYCQDCIDTAKVAS